MIRTATLATATLATTLLLTPPTAEAREVSCGQGTTLKAKNGDTKSTITFTNRTPDKQTVYWVDYDGKRHKYQELDPGESYDQPTFLTHPWLVTGLRDECVGFYLADGKKTSVEPGIAPRIKPITKKKKVAALPKVEDRASVRKPASSFRTPSAEIPDDDFDTDDIEDTQIARRKIAPPASTEDLSDTDFENDEDLPAKQDDLASNENDLREDDPVGDYREDDDQNEDEVAIIEPLPRTGSSRRSISPEWGDEPLTTGRQEGLSRNWRCTDYSTRTEKAICNSQRLSRLDDELERLYSSLVRALPRFQRTKLRRRQQDWLEDREVCGRRTQCIERRTKRRLSRLNQRMERVIARRGTRRLAGVRQLCKGGLTTIDGRCLRRGSRPTGLVCRSGFYDNGNGRCVRRSRERAGGNGRLPAPGQSLGGRVRDIPGLDGRRVTSLREGTPVTVLESTGERHRGYEWFKIRYSGGTGYQWGGIICTNRRVPGVFNTCR